MSLATESLLGPYQIRSRVGSGAMGEVYRAFDTRLGREVAIKIVAPEAHDDPDRDRRLQREARAISALNHPNILTVHDIGFEDGVTYLVTELVEGKPLRALLAKEPLSVRQALDIGIQIAEGLASAHEAAVVHRDLKPENVMITREGRVKILDFGLAKAESEMFPEGAPDSAATAPGVLLGTAAYMSPEQARGGDVRFYADQFALGLILYEMLTGDQPFRKPTALQTLSAILTEESPQINRGPVPLRWLILRCLHKEPDHRYASTLDLVRELHNIRNHLGESFHSDAVLEPVPERPRRAWPRAGAYVKPVAALLAAVLLGAALMYSLIPSSSQPDWNYTPLAVSAALEASPVWSPNGQSVAYAGESQNVLQIFSRSEKTTAPVQLTFSGEDCHSPFWDPSGRRIFFIARSAGEPALWSVGAAGGTPRLVLQNVSQAAISPDGRMLAALRPDSATLTASLWIGPPTGQTLRRYNGAPLAKLAMLPWSPLRFAPDGKRLAIWANLISGHSEFWLVPLPEGEPRRALENLRASPLFQEFSWTPDSEEIVFSDREGYSIGSHLYRVNLASGAVTPLTAGPSGELSPSMRRDGRSVAFATGRGNYDLAELDFSQGGLRAVNETPTSELSPSRGLKQSMLLFASDRNGRPEIWLEEQTASILRPLVRQEDFDGGRTRFFLDLALSPDQQRVAYRLSGSQDESIWISTLGGDPPLRLASEAREQYQRGPSWSPDGNWIAYFSLRSGRYVTMKAHVGGPEAPQAIAEDGGTYPRWSPAGDWIASLSPAEGVIFVRPDGSGFHRTGGGQWLVHGWSAGGQDVLGIQIAPGRMLRLVKVNAASGEESVLRDLGVVPAAWIYGLSKGVAPLRGFEVSREGNSALTSAWQPSSDIWIMSRR